MLKVQSIGHDGQICKESLNLPLDYWDEVFMLAKTYVLYPDQNWSYVRVLQTQDVEPEVIWDSRYCA